MWQGVQHWGLRWLRSAYPAFFKTRLGTSSGCITNKKVLVPFLIVYLQSLCTACTCSLSPRSHTCSWALFLAHQIVPIRKAVISIIRCLYPVVIYSQTGQNFCNGNLYWEIKCWQCKFFTVTKWNTFWLIWKCNTTARGNILPCNNGSS